MHFKSIIVRHPAAGAAPAPPALTTSSLRVLGTNGTRPLVDRQRPQPMRHLGWEKCLGHCHKWRHQRPPVRWSPQGLRFETLVRGEFLSCPRSVLGGLRHLFDVVSDLPGTLERPLCMQVGNACFESSLRSFWDPQSLDWLCSDWTDWNKILCFIMLSEKPYFQLVSLLSSSD